MRDRVPEVAGVERTHPGPRHPASSKEAREHLDFLENHMLRPSIPDFDPRRQHDIEVVIMLFPVLHLAHR